MEVVRNSDIAQLVLGYLRDQNLEQAAYSFCKTSPYLTEEYRLLKRGLRTMSMGSGILVDIIKEHCQIKSKVSQTIDHLPVEGRRNILKENTLVGKISFLIKMLIKEKKLRRTDDGNRQHLKRTRSNDSINNIEMTMEQDLPEYDSTLHSSKRRRTSSSYFFLNNSTMINDLATEEEEEEDNDYELSSDTDISEIQIKRSKTDEIERNTSSNKSSLEANSSPNQISSMSTIPVLSETILKKTEFQNVLVENINKALQTSMQENLSNIDSNENNMENNEKNKEQTQDELTAQLDEMIKNILHATEQDPTFNEVIEEIINITNSAKKSNKEARLSSSQKENKCRNNNINKSEKWCTSNKSTQMTPRRESDFSEIQITSKANNSTSLPMKTVLTSTAKFSENSETNETTTIIPLMDSNLQSKFIVFNSNETLGTLGNDSTFLSCTNLNNLQTFNTNDQVFIDINSGQMSIPVIMGNDNVALPIFINNGDVTNIQQQSDNNIESNNVNQLQTQQIVVQSEADEVNISEINGTNVNNDKIVATNSLDSNFANLAKQTPHDNNIKVPTQSFSTPRRRTSHIRVLNFGTPSKSQDQSRDGEETMQQKSLTKGESVYQTQSSQPPLPHVAENVVVQTSSEPKTVPNTANDDRVVNEIASSSNSLDIDFEQSNQTVIQRQISTKTSQCKTDEKVCIHNLAHQPIVKINKKKKNKESKNVINDKKRKFSTPLKTKKRKTRQNHYEMKEERNEELDISKATNNDVKGLDPMEEWNKMRATFTNRNWDQHLREIQSKSLLAATNVIRSKKRSKRKQEKSSKKDKAKKKSKKHQVETKNDRESKEKGKKENTSDEVNKITPIKIVKASAKLPSSLSTQTSPSSSLKIQPAASSVHKKGLIKFKIPTPTKKSRSIHITGESKEKDDVEQKKQTTKNTESSLKKEMNVLLSNTESSLNNNKVPSSSNDHLQPSLANEKGKGFGNMALLLETPYKTTIDAHDTRQIPITPRFIMPSIEETPFTKMMKIIQTETSDHDQILDNIDTPNFAITPGSGLMTSMNSEKETPNSGCGGANNRPTDYSSSGSYYKPDESEDLDRHLDRLLFAERQKKIIKPSIPSTSGAVAEATDIYKTSDKNVNRDSTINTDNMNSGQQQQQQNKIKSPTIVPSLEKNSKNNNSGNNSHKLSSNAQSQQKFDLALCDISSSEEEYEKDDLFHKKKNRMEHKRDEKSSTKKIMIDEKLSKEKVKQLSDLEQKRLRMKEKLRGDFSTTGTTTTTTTAAAVETLAAASIESTTSKKLITKRERTTATAVVERKRTTIGAVKPSIKRQKRRPAINKRSNSSIISVSAVIETCFPPPSPPTDEVSKDRMDVLRALNLSAKKAPNPTVPVAGKEEIPNIKTKTIVEAFVENDNAITEDIFEHEHISKVRSSLAITTTTTTMTDDSRESAESVKVRNAAMALTTLQKKLSSQINYDKIEVIQQKTKVDDNEEQENKSSPPGIEIFKIATNATIAATKPITATAVTTAKNNATPIVTRSSRFLVPSEKEHSAVVQNRKHSTRKVKLTPKAKCLSKSSITGTKRLYQTFTSPTIQTRSKRLECTPQKEIYEVPTNLKKNTKKSTKENENQKCKAPIDLSPIIIKQPKVILEVMTEEQLRISPSKQFHQQQQQHNSITNDNQINCSHGKNDEEKENLISNKNRRSILENQEIVRKSQVIETCNKTQNNQKPKYSIINEENENRLKIKNVFINNEEEDTRNDIDENDDDVEEEEDPYDECKMITIDENDKERFIKVVHSSDSNKNYYYETDNNKSALQTEMKVYLNEIPHIIKVSDEIELFSKDITNNKLINTQNNLENLQQQQQRRIIKNIPKKREKSAHILHYHDNLPPSSSSSLPSLNLKSSSLAVTISKKNEDQHHHDNNSSDGDKFPPLTSSPCKPKFRLLYKDRSKKPVRKNFYKISVNLKKKENAANKSAKTKHLDKPISVKNYEFVVDDGKLENVLIAEPPPSPASDDQAKILRQEDIYAVLSHLHGTDDARS